MPALDLPPLAAPSNSSTGDWLRVLPGSCPATRQALVFELSEETCPLRGPHKNLDSDVMSLDRERNPDARRSLPAVDRLSAAVSQAAPELPRWALLQAVREVLEAARSELGDAPAKRAQLPQEALSEQDLAEKSAVRARELARLRPGPVINATGIALHTNLGRAPLAAGAVAAASAAAGFADLELALGRGERDSREHSVAEKLRLLSGAEAAHAVNNNAAALLLALDTLAAGREVIVSRGELVEIGGSFRLPEILARARVRLVEVGTTNRTRSGDYAAAIGPDTGLLLKVHRSNFELRGFVAEASLPELAALGRARGLPVVEDLGSGTLVDLRDRGFPDESYVPDRLRLGADLVCFSGDKLLGGPQSGLLLGSRELVDALRHNPLARALRLDKLSLAALDWTLEAYLDGRALREIPLLRMLLCPAPELERRARRLGERLARLARARIEIEVLADRGEIGGGTLPGVSLETWVVALKAPGGAEDLARRLRGAPLPVVARIREGRVLLDLRTISDEDEPALERGLAAVLDAAR